MDIKINYNGIDKSGKNAVVYARYSSHSQNEQSIDGQLAAARAYAEARGYTIIHEYIDRAMTGRNDNRDEFQQMLSDCAKKQFQVIIVWKVDRFGRNREEITFNKYRAKKHGVRVEYVAENLPDSPEGVILESVLEGMAEYYSLQLSQNIRRGYRENAKRCKYAGGRIPLGYKLAEDKTFAVDPDTAPLVSRIYKMYAEGWTITEIITVLNAEGLHTSEGKPFTKNSLRTVLKNEKYIGDYVFKAGTPEEIRIPNGVPAIVDRDTYDRVQRLLQTNQRAPAARWNKADYLLTDKLFCGSCGAQMVGESGTSKTGKIYNYYLCTNHKRKKSCSRKAIRQEWLESYVLDQTTTLIMDDEVIQFITDSVWEYYLAQDQRREKLKALQAQLSEVEKGINNLMRAIEAGMPLTEMTKNRLSELDAQRTALTTTIAATQLDGGFQLTKDHIQFFLEQFRELDYTDRKAQQRLIDVFVNSIYITDDEMTINFNFGGDRSQIKFTDFDRLRAGGVFDCRASCSTSKKAVPLGAAFLSDAFLAERDAHCVRDAASLVMQSFHLTMKRARRVRTHRITVSINERHRRRFAVRRNAGIT